jgi:hypothetical protein
MAPRLRSLQLTGVSFDNSLSAAGDNRVRVAAISPEFALKIRFSTGQPVTFAF